MVSTNLISRVINNLIRDINNGNNWPYGIYNLVPKGISSWHQIAKLLFEIVNSNNIKLCLSNEKSIKPIKSKDYKSNVKRPLNSSLNNKKIQSYIDFDLPKWEDDFQQVVKNLIKNDEI